MSSSSDITLGTIGADAGIPNLNVAKIPENIRNGGSKAMQAYSEGLAFEDMLVNELSQQLANTMYGGGGTGASASADGTSSDGTGGSSSGGMLSGASAYASMIPQTLTSSIMSDGGLGMAEQFAQEFDPSLLSQGDAGAGAGAGSGTTAAAGKAAGDVKI